MDWFSPSCRPQYVLISAQNWNDPHNIPASVCTYTHTLYLVRFFGHLMNSNRVPKKLVKEASSVMVLREKKKTWWQKQNETAEKKNYVRCTQIWPMIHPPPIQQQPGVDFLLSLRQTTHIECPPETPPRMTDGHILNVVMCNVSAMLILATFLRFIVCGEKKHRNKVMSSSLPTKWNDLLLLDAQPNKRALCFGKSERDRERKIAQCGMHHLVIFNFCSTSGSKDFFFWFLENSMSQLPVPIMNVPVGRQHTEIKLSFQIGSSPQPSALDTYPPLLCYNWITFIPHFVHTPVVLEHPNRPIIRRANVCLLFMCAAAIKKRQNYHMTVRTKPISQHLFCMSVCVCVSNHILN